MINKGEIIQIKNLLRMPYSSNKNTISSCRSQITSKDHSRAQLDHAFPYCSSKKRGSDSSRSKVIKDDGSSKSSGAFSSMTEDANGKKEQHYISCKAKYNNKNKSLMICKRASSGHFTANYNKKI